MHPCPPLATPLCMATPLCISYTVQSTAKLYIWKLHTTHNHDSLLINPSSKGLAAMAKVYILWRALKMGDLENDGPCFQLYKVNSNGVFIMLRFHG